MMKTHIACALSLVFLGLAACGPLPVYYKTGSDQTRTNSDTLTCEVKAQKEAPVANQIRQRPPVYYPGRSHCNSAGNCWTSPGYWVDGGTYTVDVNQGLRRQLVQNCMAQKGYRRLELPRCTKEQIAVLQSQPKSARSAGGLPAEACAVRQSNGNTVILPPL
ncbi:MAG: hypothetical protein BM560_02945 [Roseobacter sp. MedPE-SWde]|nr:MAG: hypothetical protein BM560_02945 [Roseobacter sp. MedPE-SWde]